MQFCPYKLNNKLCTYIIFDTYMRIYMYICIYVNVYVMFGNDYIYIYEYIYIINML